MHNNGWWLFIVVLLAFLFCLRDVHKGGKGAVRGPDGNEGGGSLLNAMHVAYDHRPSHPYNVGTEHVVFSPTRQTLLIPSVKRNARCLASRVKGELHPTKNSLRGGLAYG